MLTPIKTAEQLREYYREFQGIANILIKNQVLSARDGNSYFWCGLHESTRNQLLPALSIHFPDHPHNLFHPKDAPVVQKQSQSIPSVTTTPSITQPTSLETPTSPDNVQDLMDRLGQLKIYEPEYATTFTKIQAFAEISRMSCECVRQSASTREQERLFIGTVFGD